MAPEWGTEPACANCGAPLSKPIAQALKDLAAAWDAEYERLTAKAGAYGNTKVRAAYRLGSGLLAQAAAKLEEGKH